MHFDAIVVGAGFAGLYQLHALRDRLGMKVRVLEAGSDIGGTWYWNRYPGARCDSESHAYRYFFSPELYKEWQSSERYPGPEEIRAYLDFVARRLDLRRDIQFGARVVSAQFEEAENLWHIQSADGGSCSAQWLIAAVGCLSAANVPRISGLADFKGRWYHTGEWPHEGVDFAGMRVGQIGTGSTGIQAAPVIAESAGHLTVFQRTANYSVPARNAPLTPEFRRWVNDNFEELRAIAHSNVNGHTFHIDERKVFDVPAHEREKIYQQAWEFGGLQFRAAFHDLGTDRVANATASEFLKAKIRSIVKDPATAEALADIDHPYAAKRPPIDSNYFETFNRPNVSLVDLRKDPFERITASGIKTRSREHALDMIVFATGFDAMTAPLFRLGLRGRGGRALREDWKAGPETYLGLQVPGYPNFFTITGPGSPSVLTNMPVAIEQHVEWIAGCIDHARSNGIATVEASAESARKWGKTVQAMAKLTVLWDAKHSWYFGANVEGKPQVFMPYAGGLNRYRKICQQVAERGYEGFHLG
jgi:cation diffusion facilitator CzcD-associated flavoprotein CzcO